LRVEQLETRLVPASLLDTFELDGNAKTGVLGSAGSTNPSHDWDQVYADFLAGNTATSGAGVVAFVTDTFGPDSTSFTEGSKDINDISTWAWQSPEHTEDKNDLLHAFVAAYIQDGDLFMYFGADRFAQNGDAKIGFWFFQNSVSLNPTNNTFNGSHAVGDILVESTFTNGGGVPTVQVFRWVGSGGNFPGGTLDLLLPPNSPDTFAIVNDSPQISPWIYVPKTPPTGIFPVGGFYEGGINLTNLLEGAGALEPGECLDFSSFMANTPSSQSLKASLDDFVLGTASISTCGSISWEKRDTAGNLVGGATFEISPNPDNPNLPPLQVVDNTGQQGYTGADTDPTPGEFRVVDIHPGTYTVTETVAPPGYALDPNPTRTVAVPSSGNLNVSIGTPGSNDESDFHDPPIIPAIQIVKLTNGTDDESKPPVPWGCSISGGAPGVLPKCRNGQLPGSLGTAQGQLDYNRCRSGAMQ
jgi:hypothetical protein